MATTPLTRIIALDPGGTTGWAIGYVRGEHCEVFASEERWKASGLHAWLTVQKPNRLVAEGFEYRPSYETHHGLDLTSPRLLGVCELYAFQNDIPYTEQMAAQVLGGYYTDDVLKANNMWAVGGAGHKRAATKHLLHYLHFGPGFSLGVEKVTLDPRCRERKKAVPRERTRDPVVPKGEIEF